VDNELHPADESFLFLIIKPYQVDKLVKDPGSRGLAQFEVKSFQHESFILV
jgi:hypothetical protein